MPFFIFYGGKGGVGKTTCATARASVEAAAGRRVLVVSTDPAHSLGDVFAVPLSSTPRLIRRGRRGTLHALELDAPRAFARWLRQHRMPLGDILEHGTWLDRGDVDALLDLSIPGVDELVGLLEIARLSDAGSADLIIVDTAPTGHALRLLAAPEAVGVVASVLGDLQEEHRLIRQQLARVGRPEAADRLIALLAGQARAMAARLRDPLQSAVHWVTLPEDLSLAETGDAIASLEASGIHAGTIVINRVLPDGGPCPVCDRRREDERRVVAAIRRRLAGGRHLVVVSAADSEPRGVKALSTIGRQLKNMTIAVVAAESPALQLAVSLPSDAHTVAAETLAVFDDATLLFFGGKGGVGKTTVAAATALRLARARPRRRVLLLSTDPAHSLGDVLGARVDDTPAVVSGAPRNLFVREVDAPRALAARRADLDAALGEIAAAFGATGERSSELMELAPPGIDELFGMLTVMEARDRYDVIVLDTAPTGHALRLLEMPDTARDWVQLLLRVLLKYKSLVRPGQLAAELVKVSQGIRALQVLLHDKKQTRFVVVTRAAAVPRAETARLIVRLRRLKLAAPAIVANALTLAPGACRRCRATAAAERRELRALCSACGRRFRDCAIIQTPLTAPPPRGVRALEQWAEKWIAGDGGR